MPGGDSGIPLPSLLHTHSKPPRFTEALGPELGFHSCPFFLECYSANIASHFWYSVCGCGWVCPCRCGSENSLLKWGLSFYYVCLGDQSQGKPNPLPLEPSHWPSNSLFYYNIPAVIMGYLKTTNEEEEEKKEEKKAAVAVVGTKRDSRVLSLRVSASLVDFLCI